jgi:Sortase domain
VSGRLRRWVGAIWAVPVVLLVGCGTAVPPTAPPDQHAAPRAVVPPTGPVAEPAPHPAGPRPGPAPLSPDDPVALTVPAIDVRTGPLLRLGLDPRGALEVPPDAGTAGWFTLGPTPGASGPAVIAGHVDYGGVPGVFHRLRDLVPGDEVSVTRADGTTAVFSTYSVEHYPKEQFPSDRVYGNTAGPELRLITCGGAFDPATGHYRDNVIAYARVVRGP